MYLRCAQAARSRMLEYKIPQDAQWGDIDIMERSLDFTGNTHTILLSVSTVHVVPGSLLGVHPHGRISCTDQLDIRCAFMANLLAVHATESNLHRVNQQNISHLNSWKWRSSSGALFLLSTILTDLSSTFLG
jgi:hypothetical protein